MSPKVGQLISNGTTGAPILTGQNRDGTASQWTHGYNGNLTRLVVWEHGMHSHGLESVTETAYVQHVPPHFRMPSGDSPAGQPQDQPQVRSCIAPVVAPIGRGVDLQGVWSIVRQGAASPPLSASCPD